MRLRRIRAFRAPVHRPAAMLSPARGITASAPSSRATYSFPASGSHGIWSGAAPGSPRTRRTTRWPRDVSSGISADPIRPCEPVTRTFTRGHTTPPRAAPARDATLGESLADGVDQDDGAEPGAGRTPRD